MAILDWKTAISVASFALVLKITHKLLIRTRKLKEEAAKQDIKNKLFNEVIMFSSDQPRNVRSVHAENLVTESMSKLLNYLNSARHSLDLCLYLLTNKELVDMICLLHHRGIKIRCILDLSMGENSDAATKTLEAIGVPVIHSDPKDEQNLMHHKFCLIDASKIEDTASETVPLVLTGSLNWTTQAVYGNWESVIVTSRCDIIKEYNNEFNRLWSRFNLSAIKNKNKENL